MMRTIIDRCFPWIRYKKALLSIANSTVPAVDPGLSGVYRLQDAVFAARTIAREALNMDDIKGITQWK